MIFEAHFLPKTKASRTDARAQKRESHNSSKISDLSHLSHGCVEAAKNPVFDRLSHWCEEAEKSALSHWCERSEIIALSPVRAHPKIVRGIAAFTSEL